MQNLGRGRGRGIIISSEPFDNTRFWSKTAPPGSVKSVDLFQSGAFGVPGRASDDTRVDELRRHASRFNDANDQKPIVKPSAEDFSCAQIYGHRFSGYPVYCVYNVGDSQCTLVSIGAPYRTLLVDKSRVYFNDIDMRDVRSLKDLFRNGDHVLVKKQVGFYQNRSNATEWRALSIGFPRWSERKLLTGARWITQGSLNKSGEEQGFFVDTDIEVKGYSGTVLIRVSEDVLGTGFTPFDHCTVFVRAVLEEDDSGAWSKSGSLSKTPWNAEKLVPVNGLQDGVGSLTRGYKRVITAIMAPGFGYVYIPPALVTTDMDKARDGAQVKFCASVNTCPTLRNYKFKWRAVQVTLSVTEGSPKKCALASTGSKKAIPKSVHFKTEDELQTVTQFSDCNTALQQGQKDPCTKCSHELVCICP